MIPQHDIGCRDNNARRMTATLPQTEPRAVQSQKQIAQSDNQDDRNQKEQRIVIPVIEIMSGNHVVSRIMDVVKLDMILEKSSANGAMAEISMK
jgi:hypothetical protein